MTHQVKVEELKNVDLKKLTLNRIVKNKKIYYNILNDDKKFYIKTHYFYNTFPIGDYKGNKKYSVQLNIDEEYYKLLSNLKNKIVELIFNDKNILKDLKKKKIKSKEVLSSIFNFSINEREYEDKKFYNLKLSFNNVDDDNLKVSVLLNKDKLSVNNKINSNELIKILGTKNQSKYLISPYLYIIGGNIGCSLKVELMKLKEDSRERNLQSDFSNLLLDDE